MRTFFVILLSPRLDLSACVCQIHKPVRVQALIPEASVETFHVPVLHRFAGLDVMHCDARSLHHSVKYRLVNSGPLSHRVAQGPVRGGRCHANS